MPCPPFPVRPGPLCPRLALDANADRRPPTAVSPPPHRPLIGTFVSILACAKKLGWHDPPEGALNLSLPSEASLVHNSAPQP